MERHIMTWQREHAHDGLHPLFDDILRRQLMLPIKGKGKMENGEVGTPAANVEPTHDLLRLGLGSAEARPA